MGQDNTNTVAKILKVYAIINAVAGCILGLIAADTFNGALVALFIGLCIVTSFVIYAFGEVIQLLQDIKDGTRGTIKTIQNQNNSDKDELPSI